MDAVEVVRRMSLTCKLHVKDVLDVEEGNDTRNLSMIEIKVKDSLNSQTTISSSPFLVFHKGFRGIPTRELSLDLGHHVIQACACTGLD